ncbi:YeeE/YedE family protein [Agarivorans litoreus]|uniref:YeeE/YedE family protein n=1 Tax=Agarivorans litoreus TaxID=1510455 RepID=UPI001C7DB658|nr:YeeE/YedE thiosulfate transporter family protein [Agarivorans litoreus]
MSNFTPWSALLGGMLLGLSASLLLLLSGRTAGISGVLGGIFGAAKSEWPWRVAFVGAMAASVLVTQPLGVSVPVLPNYSLAWIVFAGLAVGVGTQLANGCTSGHGICGIGRFSPRSIVATGVFMITAALVVGVSAYLGAGYV